MLHFGDDPSGTSPGVGLIAESHAKALLVLGVYELDSRLGCKALDFSSEPVIGDQSNGVIDAMPFAEAIHRGHRKACIGSKDDIRLGLSLFELFDDPFEHTNCSVRSVGVEKRSTAPKANLVMSSKTKSWTNIDDIEREELMRMIIPTEGKGKR
jgi:hypothetical protein